MKAGCCWVLLVAACGSPPGARPTAPEPAPVEVPAPEEPEAETAGMPESEPRSAATLESCIERFREAPGEPPPPSYASAIDSERAGDLNAARRSYFELVSNEPKSPFVPLAYLAFAEIFRRESEADPSKIELARQSYREVAKYPNSGVHAYARLRLAELEVKRGDDQEALAGYFSALETARRESDTACGERIVEAARAGLVSAYVAVGRPDRAWAFLARAAPGPEREELLWQLIDAYLKVGKTSDACAALSAAGDAARSRPRPSECP